jgi:hypothetical protein
MPTCSETEAFRLPPSGSRVSGITCENDEHAIAINATGKKCFMAKKIKS